MLKPLAAFAAFVFAMIPAAAADQNVCPCFPSGYVWVVTSCETWNCAQAAMIMANGDAYTMAAPTGGSKFKWVVVRRVLQGSVTVSPDEPFMLDSYDSAADGAAHFSTFGPEMLPIMLTTLDGRTLVLRLRQADTLHHRVVAH